MARNQVSHLKIMNTLALVIVAVLVIVSQIIIQKAINDQNNDAHIINIAGRQRMLSQKISKSALAILHADSSSNELTLYLQEMENAFFLWEESHIGLKSSDKTQSLSGLSTNDISNNFQALDSFFTPMKEGILTIIADSTKTLDAKKHPMRSIRFFRMRVNFFI